MYRLQVVKLIQVCLMEWTSSIAMREKLVKCGCVNLMFTELRNLTLNTHLGSNQVVICVVIVGSLNVVRLLCKQLLYVQHLCFYCSLLSISSRQLP